MSLRLLPLVGLLTWGCGLENTAIDETLTAYEELEAAREPAKRTSAPASSSPAAPPQPPLAPAAQPALPGGDVPPVVLVWTGISELHKGFFTTEDLVAQLAADLHGKVDPPVNIHIRFNGRSHKGSIELQLLPGTLRVPVGGEGTLIGLQELTPITAALASYRSGVASRFDLRVDSFRVGIESYRGAKRCFFGVAGLRPPDGRTISNCVEVNSVQHCGEAEPKGYRFSGASADQVRECLR